MEVRKEGGEKSKRGKKVYAKQLNEKCINAKISTTKIFRLEIFIFFTIYMRNFFEIGA